MVVSRKPTFSMEGNAGPLQYTYCRDTTPQNKSLPSGTALRTIPETIPECSNLGKEHARRANGIVPLSRPSLEMETASFIGG
ncbi:hypothetical protein ACFLV4_03015 [Chloroflexota bacterium]